MITLFNSTDYSKDRIIFTYNGMNYNDESVNRTTTALYEFNIATVTDQFDFITEPLLQTHGLESYEPRKLVTMIRIDGYIRAPTIAVLMDAVMDLNARFDPVNTYLTNSSVDVNRGYLPLDFNIPTADTFTYATGLIPARYYVRSVDRPVKRTSQFEGLSCAFSLLLQAADPRLYLQTLDSASRSNAGTIATNNSEALFPSWPTVTLTFTGSGSGQVSIARDGINGGTMTVDATGYVSTDVMVIDMARRTIKKNGTLIMSDFISGAYQYMPSGQFPTDTSFTWTIANVSGTLAATVLVEWRRAFA